MHMRAQGTTMSSSSVVLHVLRLPFFRVLSSCVCVCMWSHMLLRSLHMCSDKESKDAAPHLSMNAPQTGRSTRQNEEACPRLCRDKTGAYERGDSLLKTFAFFRFLAP